MKKTLSALSLVCGVLLVALWLTACEQGVKKVHIRYKHIPGMTTTFQQITRGVVKAEDKDTKKLLQHEYVEATMDITNEVRRVREDSTAEIMSSNKNHWRSRNMLDKTTTDTVQSSPSEGVPILEYTKPNGRMVDLEYASDTTKGDLNYLKEYYKQGFPVFPDGEVGQGYSWTQATTVVLPEGPVEASTTYTVKSFARERGYDCVVIEYDGTCIIPLPTKQAKNYERVSGVDKITSKGHLYFAYTEGIIVSIKERYVLNSDRVLKESMTEPEPGYQPGQKVNVNVGLEYDVDFYVTSLKTP
jgi:hypothetical protein